jgi:hypothetical protein
MDTVLSIALSVIALIFSIYVFINNRTRDRRDILMKMHDLLISDDLQRGRYLLFDKVVDEDSVDRLSDQDYRDINRAIAAFNLLGIYVKNGYVREQDVMDAWGRSIYRSWITAQPFLSHREKRHGYPVAVYFGSLAKRASEVLAKNGNLPEYKVLRRSQGNE